MATPPTVLATASLSTSPLTNSASGKAKFTFAPVIAAVIASAFVASLGVGGAMYYLGHSGRLPGAPNALRKPEIVAPPAPSHLVVLEPLLVNLADAGGTSYLRIALALRVLDGNGKTGAATKEEKDSKSTSEDLAPVRDTALTVLGSETSDELLAADGKDQLRAAMKAALAKRNPELKIQDVFLTDFLVQR